MRPRQRYHIRVDAIVGRNHHCSQYRNWSMAAKRSIVFGSGVSGGSGIIVLTHCTVSEILFIVFVLRASVSTVISVRKDITIPWSKPLSSSFRRKSTASSSISVAGIFACRGQGRYGTPEQPIHYCGRELLCLFLTVLLFKLGPQFGINCELYGIYISNHLPKKSFLEEPKHSLCLLIRPTSIYIALS